MVLTRVYAYPARRSAHARILHPPQVPIANAEEVEQVCEEAENVPMVEVVEVMEPEVVVDEGGRSKGRPKRRRNA